MPSLVASTVGLGLIFAILGFTAPAIIFGVAALAWEGFLFYMEGRT